MLVAVCGTVNNNTADTAYGIAIHKISTAQKYWFFSNAENVFPTGIFSFFTTLILTFSSQFLKHVISIRSAKTAQIAIVFTHAAWSSPNNLTSGVVNVTAMILPIGESAIRTILNISLSLEDLVIIADKLPYGRFNAV